MNNLYKLACILAVGYATATAKANAHAFLSKATPAVGSSIKVTPAEVRLRFSEEIQPAFSQVKVFDSNGREVDKRNQHADKSDAAVLAVGIPKLQNGKYRVVWKAMCDCGHITHGEFSFQVNER